MGATCQVLTRGSICGMHDGPIYALLNRDGEVMEMADTLSDAIAEARRLVGDNFYVDAPETEAAAERGEETLALAANQGDVVPLRSKTERAPHDALRAVAAGMGRAARTPLVNLDEALRIPLDDAWQALVPYFPTKRPRIGVHSFESPKKMADALLGQNYKTEKKTPKNIRDAVADAYRKLYGGRERAERNASVMGLSLVPHTHSYTNAPVQEVIRRTRSVYGVAQTPNLRVNACVRASKECSKSCLVFSGRNLLDEYNMVKKLSLLNGFLHQPEAFTRMLYEAVQRHLVWGKKGGILPLVRLNVFSDIPWELVLGPEFFERSDVIFYDYTKVPARKTPRNYDLTFSFSGTEQNVDDLDYEIKRSKRRVAIVFAKIGLRRRKGQHVEIPSPMRPRAGKLVSLPDTFLGLPVVDGDVSDMRPFDPAPAVVGLRWKSPYRQDVVLKDVEAFVVKGNVVDGHFIVMPEVPRHTDITLDPPPMGLPEEHPLSGIDYGD